tara:strand:+ start:518 stop:823 length:306 start_codon:yes stop_codon:yes gene_type:complete
MKMFKFYLYFIIIIFALQSCGSLKEAGKVLRNEKVNTTDEFLIEKKGALSVPPDYTDLPLPKSKKSQKEDIEKIINIDTAEVSEKELSGTLEEKILKNIKE